MASTQSPAKKSRFHNFSFPTMSWGSQRILRCVNPASGFGGLVTGSTILDTRFESLGEKTALSSPVSPLPMPSYLGRSIKEKEEGREDSSSAAAEEEAATAVRPWNLRTRRAACYAPSQNGRNRHPCSSPFTPPPGKDDPTKAALQRSVVSQIGKPREFSLTLSREEIEDDYYAFKGSKPNRRPKKRPRIVQNQLDCLFPGLWLSEVTIDAYKVIE